MSASNIFNPFSSSSRNPYPKEEDYSKDEKLANLQRFGILPKPSKPDRRAHSNKGKQLSI